MAENAKLSPPWRPSLIFLAISPIYGFLSVCAFGLWFGDPQVGAARVTLVSKIASIFNLVSLVIYLVIWFWLAASAISWIKALKPLSTAGLALVVLACPAVLILSVPLSFLLLQVI